MTIAVSTLTARSSIKPSIKYVALPLALAASVCCLPSAAHALADPCEGAGYPTLSVPDEVKVWSGQQTTFQFATNAVSGLITLQPRKGSATMQFDARTITYAVSVVRSFGTAGLRI